MEEARVKNILQKIYADLLMDKINTEQMPDIILNRFNVTSMKYLLKDDLFLKYNSIFNELAQATRGFENNHKRIGLLPQLFSLLWGKKIGLKIEELGILHDLIKDSFYTVWSNKDKKLYNKGYEIMTSWKDYFLSYTRKSLPATNNDFKKLVAHHLPAKARSVSIDDENLLAKLIAKCLSENNLDGFFDCDDLKTGETIGTKIFEYCDKTFALVQLLEKPSFKPIIGGKNWCFEEYSAFKSKLKTSVMSKHSDFCFQFLIPKKWSYTPPLVIPSAYRDWITHCSSIKYKDNLVQYNHNCGEFPIVMQEVASSILIAREKIMSFFWT